MKRPPTPAKRIELVKESAIQLTEDVAQRGRTLAEGGHYSYRDASRNPPRLLIGISPEAHHGEEKVALIDIESGETLAEVPRSRHLCEAAGVVRAWVGDPLTPAVIRLEDGAILQPEPRRADGTPLEATKTTVVAIPESDHVLVFATDQEGHHHYGLWQDMSSAVVTLDRIAPFSVRSYAFDTGYGSFDVVHGFGRPASHGRGEGNCVRARTPAEGQAKCRAYGVSSRRSPTDRYQTWLGNDWVTDGSAGFVMAHNTRTGVRQWVAPPECRARLIAALAMPPRTLTVCEGDGSQRRYSLWRPGASVLFEAAVISGNTFHNIGLARSSIIPATTIDLQLSASTFWVDLLRGTVVESESLRPIRSGSQTRVTLATLLREEGESTESTVELVELDFDRVTQRTIARYNDCPGELQMLAEPSERRFAVGCLRQLHQATESHEYTLLWSEVIDLDVRRRWRSSSMIEALLQDGRVIGSNRDRHRAESIVTSTELYLLEL